MRKIRPAGIAAFLTLAGCMDGAAPEAQVGAQSTWIVHPGDVRTFRDLTDRGDRDLKTFVCDRLPGLTLDDQRDFSGCAGGYELTPRSETISDVLRKQDFGLVTRRELLLSDGAQSVWEIRMRMSLDDDGRVAWATTLDRELPYAEVASQNTLVGALRTEVAGHGHGSWTPDRLRARPWHMLEPELARTLREDASYAMGGYAPNVLVGETLTPVGTARLADYVLEIAADPGSSGVAGYVVPIETATSIVSEHERRGVLKFYNAFGHVRGHAYWWSDLPDLQGSRPSER